MCIRDILEKEVRLNTGINRLVIPVEIPEPELWMPNGWGKPVLYDFEVTVWTGGKMVDRKRQRIGLRSIRVVKEKDAGGESFYFEVNGIPMFAKGANYIPSDAMLPAVTTERYRTLFRNIREANMNMIRVWGGGVYEDDRFYDLADENGILIWQDFMFACTTYPHDSAFLARVEAEAQYNIRRLRNHACLAMWCGNNEILEGLKYWGWNKKYTPEVYNDMTDGYRILFQELLPSWVEKWDSGRFYMHGSPYFANWGRPESWKVADSHNWGVWYGRKPFSSLVREIPRFMSEFGFQSFPEMKTIAAFAAPEDYQIESEVMNAHQKSTIGNDLIRTYMEREYVLPQKFEDFVYVGLVMQGLGIRRGLEAHRRNRPYCMGSLYWQLNDSWPVVSWSGLDYYGNWKALHYQAKRAFSPLAADVVQQEDTLQIWLMSDRLQDMDDLTLEMQLTDFYGKLLKKEKHRVKVPANSSVQVLEQKLADWVTPRQARQCYLLVTLKDKTGKKWSEEPYFFNVPKDLDLPDVSIEPKVKTGDGVCEVTLKSAVLAKDVFIEIPVHGARFSDNFFDLLPGVARK
ncbi:MAG: glycoside hydrolase family 2 protein, partial [Odoribacter sp.]|nr:glycoside hydrolase family 2 protein [Odoribacter sp.]